MSPPVFQLCTQLWHSNITIPLCSYLTCEKVFKILLKGKETPLCILMCPERIYRVVIKNQGFWNSVDLDFTPGLPTCWLCGAGCPGGSAVKNLPAHAEDVGLIPGFRTIAWRRKWQPTPVFFPGKSLGQKSLVGYFMGLWKSWTRLSNWTTRLYTWITHMQAVWLWANVWMSSGLGYFSL